MAIRTVSLPHTASELAAPLAALARACYPDMAVSVQHDEARWLVRLFPVGELTRARDSAIAATLARLGVSFDEMMNWHRLDDRGPVVWLESMYHSWALLAWSCAWRRRGNVRPWLVHVAPTADLGTPALLGSDNGSSLLAIMEDMTLDLDNQDSVRGALEKGLVGVGSYIVPWLHARAGDVVHLAPGAPATVTTVSRFALETEIPGTVSRLVMRHHADGRCSYRRTGDPASLAQGWTQGQPVLLDIDLGYFDLVPNRRHEPFGKPCSIAELVDGLLPLARSIVAVTIAYAPGSCPAGRWGQLAAELRTALMALLDSGLPTANTPARGEK